MMTQAETRPAFRWVNQFRTTILGSLKTTCFYLAHNALAKRRMRPAHKARLPKLVQALVRDARSKSSLVVVNKGREF